MFSSEDDLIRFFKKTFASKSRDILVSIGDDAAVVSFAKSKEVIVTTDCLVESVHFQINWVTPEFLGRKAALVNISDIAAMGGEPRFALISLIIPEYCRSKVFFAGLAKGMLSELRKNSCEIIGGNVSQGEKLSITITLLGTVQKNNILTRCCSSQGDLVLVTGELGIAAKELELLRQGKQRQVNVLPPNRVVFGRGLAQRGLASSCMDISDGLSLDLARLCKASTIGTCIWQEALPGDNLSLVLNGGEDYELLFTAKKSSLERIFNLGNQTNTPVSVIGEVKHKSFGIKLREASGNFNVLKPQGWDHFRPKADQPLSDG